MEGDHLGRPEGVAAISNGAGAPLPPAPGPPQQAAGPERATYREVWACGEFRALWAAQVLSVAGDQLARVALTLLVYDRTRSALLAAVTFVASIVPQFVGWCWLAWRVGGRSPYVSPMSHKTPGLDSVSCLADLYQPFS
jgi:hypothetical protein